MRRLTTEEFIERARKIHGDRYVYDESVYVRDKVKVNIKCRIHGMFAQDPGNHIRGAGCKKCGTESSMNMLRSSTDEFIKKATSIHGDRYSYDSVEYKNCCTPVSIMCKIHGVYSQTPESHLISSGCRKCSREAAAANRRSNKERFVASAISVHGEGRYEYSKVEYARSNKKVSIICPKHGEFLQRPNCHLRGKGCWECVPSRPMNTDKFILAARLKHGDKYDYSLVHYELTTEKVQVICPTHGMFTQVANCHLCGNGCPACKASTGEIAIRKALEEAGVPFIAQWAPGIPGYERCRFDFLVDDSLIFEFDGSQHFFENEFFGGKEAFMRLAERDLVKTRWAYDNGYKLLRIPYTRKHEVASIVHEAIEELGLCQTSI